MSHFQLEQWEISPQVDTSKPPLSLRFSPVIWNGEQTRISVLSPQLRSKERLAFLRPHSVDANFMVTHGPEITTFEADMSHKKLERVVRMALKNNQFSFKRVFYLQGQLCLFSTYGAAWASSSDAQGCAFEMPFEVLTEPSAHIFDWLQTQWEDLQSEVRLSWEWNQKSARQRREFFAADVPRYGELCELMRAVARIIELPEEESWNLDHVNTYSHSSELLSRLAPWRELLIARFLPFEPYRDSAPRCVRDYFQFLSSHVTVVGEKVSEHERLESVLFLREWLLKNAPERTDLLDL